MKATKNLGIWLDHSTAHLMPFSNGPIETTVIKSAFTHLAKTESLAKSEYGMHQKERHLQADFHEKLGDEIKNYESVILFGPTDAKMELLNFLKADRHFDDIRITALPADNMTENQEQAFVRAHFSQL